MPRSHPPEFRRRAVELARLREKPVAEVARDLGISDSCIRNWMAQAAVDDGSLPGLSSDERAELVALRRFAFGAVAGDEAAHPAGGNPVFAGDVGVGSSLDDNGRDDQSGFGHPRDPCLCLATCVAYVLRLNTPSSTISDYLRDADTRPQRSNHDHRSSAAHPSQLWLAPTNGLRLENRQTCSVRGSTASGKLRRPIGLASCLACIPDRISTRGPLAVILLVLVGV